MISQGQAIYEAELDKQILFYRDLLESFYTANHPQIDKGKFWVWFNTMLIGKAKCITELDVEEKSIFLSNLKESGDLLMKFHSLSY